MTHFDDRLANGDFHECSLMWGMLMKTKKPITSINIYGLVISQPPLQCLRNQTLIADVQWMKAMIPHHSSASW